MPTRDSRGRRAAQGRDAAPSFADTLAELKGAIACGDQAAINEIGASLDRRGKLRILGRIKKKDAIRVSACWGLITLTEWVKYDAYGISPW